MNNEIAEKIQRVLAICWSEKTSVCYNPEIAPYSYGQCAPTAIVIFEKFGGELLKTKVHKLSGSNIRHFYNRIDGKRIDFTADQFEIPNYWCELTYDDTESSVAEALTETLDGQIEEMRFSFEQECKKENIG